MKHTELPWGWYYHTDGMLCIGKSMTEYQAGEAVIAQIGWVGDDDERKANLEYIAKAANNHYQLVEALEYIASEPAPKPDGVEQGEWLAFLYSSRAGKAREVLAAFKEEYQLPPLSEVLARVDAKLDAKAREALANLENDNETR